MLFGTSTLSNFSIELFDLYLLDNINRNHTHDTTLNSKQAINNSQFQNDKANLEKHTSKGMGGYFAESKDQNT